MKTFKTPKGTELQIMSLKGKDYLQASQRLLWFVEENPRYDIQTIIDTSKEDTAVAKCTVVIFDEDSKVIRKVTAHKTETRKGFEDYIEKSETGALARALAMLSYGTQFAEPDLDEGTRLADSPVFSKSSVKSGAVTLDASGTSTLATPATEATPATAESAAVSRPKFGRKPAAGGGPTL